MLSAIIIPAEAVHGRSYFNKLGARRYLVISIAMVAARIAIRDRCIDQAAVSIGSCSVVASRLHAVESALIGQSIDTQPAALVTREHLHELAPIDDIRATAHYRHHAALQLVRRTITAAINSSVSGSGGAGV